MFWKDKNVFLTGAAGFIGSWLAKSLIGKGAHVFALVRDFPPQSPGFHQIPGELENYFLLERALHEYEIDTVFHLAAQTLVGTAIRSPLQTFESNIRGTYNLLEACRRYGRVKRIIAASSDKAYGESEAAYTEEMSLRGRAPYDVSKTCADLLAQSYRDTYSLPIAIARCGNVYGGGDFHWSRIVPGTIRSLLKGERPLIRSNGLLTREYLYVEDAVEAYLLLAEKGVEGPFNFGHAQAYTVLEIVKEIQSILGTDLNPVILNSASKEIPDQRLDSSKARKILGWHPHFSLSEGLGQTVGWYHHYFAAPALV